MENLKNIEKIFATFHDGTIESWNGNFDKLSLKISCSYLAEILDTDFEYFYFELKNVKKLELYTYSYINKDKNDELIIVYELKEIFSNDIDVYYAKIEENYVNINCWLINEQKNYVANKLLLNCESIKILNHNKIEITYNKLFEISDYYWAKFKGEN